MCSETPFCAHSIRETCDPSILTSLRLLLLPCPSLRDTRAEWGKREGGRLEAKKEARRRKQEEEKKQQFAHVERQTRTKKVGCKAHLPPPLFLVNPLLERYDKGMRANISIRSSSTARAESWIGASSPSFHAVESGGTHPPPHCAPAASVLFSPFLPLHSRQSEEQCASLHLFLPIPVCAWRGVGEKGAGRDERRGGSGFAQCNKQTLSHPAYSPCEGAALTGRQMWEGN